MMPSAHDDPVARYVALRALRGERRSPHGRVGSGGIHVSMRVFVSERAFLVMIARTGRNGHHASIVRHVLVDIELDRDKMSSTPWLASSRCQPLPKLEHGRTHAGAGRPCSAESHDLDQSVIATPMT